MAFWNKLAHILNPPDTLPPIVTRRYSIDTDPTPPLVNLGPITRSLAPEPPAVPTAEGTLAARLNALTLRYAGKIHGTPKGFRPESGGGQHTGANYVIESLANGQRRVVITNPTTGDRIGRTGPTVAACLDALEAAFPKDGAK